MFIDVTRYGGLKTLRLQVAAIAYLADAPSGTAIHLIGGETLRVNEDPAEIEARCAAAKKIVAIEQNGRRVEFSGAPARSSGKAKKAVGSAVQ